MAGPGSEEKTIDRSISGTREVYLWSLVNFCIIYPSTVIGCVFMKLPKGNVNYYRLHSP